MEHTKGHWYAVEYAGFWTIQDQDGFAEKADLLDADSVGEERAEANALHIIKCVNMRDVLLGGLKEIAEGKGRYDTDRLKHAGNTIEDMIEKANILIKMMEA